MHKGKQPSYKLSGPSRIHEDLRLFRKHVRSLHATSQRGVAPNSPQERVLLYDFAKQRGLKVRHSPYTYYLSTNPKQKSSGKSSSKKLPKSTE